MTLRTLFSVCALCVVSATPFVAQGGEAPDVVRVLHDWQEASVEAPRLSVDRDLATYADELSAHELEAAAGLSGPVSARSLIEQYEWTAALNDAGDIRLTAVPRDEVERLFCSAVEIRIPAESKCPAEFVYRSGQHRERAVVIAASKTNELVEPSAPVRMADTRVQQASFVLVKDEEPEHLSTPPIAEILSAWEEATRRIERADIEFLRYQYDRTYAVEKRGEGRFHFERPDRGVYELRAVEIAADAESGATSPNGNRYSLMADDPTIFYWDKGQVVLANPARRIADEFQVPNVAGIQSAGWFGGVVQALRTPQHCLPATVDVYSDNFVQRFNWSVQKFDAYQISLCGRPILAADQNKFSRLDVVLDSSTILARATRLIHPHDSSETVHVFKKFAINGDAPPDGWQPDFSGYEGLTR